jgi:hypothetical protein
MREGFSKTGFNMAADITEEVLIEEESTPILNLESPQREG